MLLQIIDTIFLCLWSWIMYVGVSTDQEATPAVKFSALVTWIVTGVNIVSLFNYIK